MACEIPDQAAKSSSAELSGTGSGRLWACRSVPSLFLSGSGLDRLPGQGRMHTGWSRGPFPALLPSWCSFWRRYGEGSRALPKVLPGTWH